MQPAGCLMMLAADDNTVVNNTRVTNLPLPSEYVLPFKQSADAIMPAVHSQMPLKQVHWNTVVMMMVLRIGWRSSITPRPTPPPTSCLSKEPENQQDPN
jgi:hypothetical protein